MFRRDRKLLEGLRSDLEDLAAAVAEIKKRTTDIEHAIPPLIADSKLQWEKVNTAIGRLSKRDAAEAKATEAGADGGALSEDQVTQMILEGYDPWQTRS